MASCSPKHGPYSLEALLLKASSLMPVSEYNSRIPGLASSSSRSTSSSNEPKAVGPNAEYKGVLLLFSREVLNEC
jgi:hypothetical protein